MAVSAAAVGAGPVVRFHAASLAGAGEAAAGDCFLTDDPQHVDCLPSLINIGAQKAGTGEIQQWLSVHPQVHVQGAEVHFFDGVRGGRTRRCRSQREAKRMRLKYARHLWRQKALSRSDVEHTLIFEKTPAYLDLASPALVSCLVPATRLLLMLRIEGDCWHLEGHHPLALLPLVGWSTSRPFLRRGVEGCSRKRRVSSRGRVSVGGQRSRLRLARRVHAFIEVLHLGRVQRPRGWWEYDARRHTVLQETSALVLMKDEWVGEVYDIHDQ